MPDIDPLLEDTKPDIQDDSVIQQYPSPTVEGQDSASFFGNNHTEGEEEQPQQQQNSHHPEHDHQQELEQQDQEEQHVQTEEQPSQPLTPHQQPVRPSITSAEELQLAAQLSQDISQGMPTMLNSSEDPNLQNVIAQHEHEHEHENEHDTQDGQLQDTQLQDPQLQDVQLQPPAQHDEQLQHEQLQNEQLQHDQLQDQLQHESVPTKVEDEHMSSSDQPVPSHTQPISNHEQPLEQQHEDQSQHQYLPDQQQQQQPNQPPSHQHQHQNQQLQHQQQELQQPSTQQPVLTHQPQIHPQVQPQPHLPPHPTHQQPPPHLQHPTSMEHLAQQYAAQAQAQAFAPDNTPPRKRSKVSRACDECRRKKVKCDAVSENGEEPCSNCRRSAIRCLFSRIPQKRGPSKGYIKELADRIHHIEGKLASEGGNVDSLTELLNGARRDSADIFSPSGQTDDNGRKRPYSSISGAEFGTPTSSRQGTWGSEPRPIQPYQTPTSGGGGGLRGTPYSANGLAPQPLSLSKSDAGTPSQPAAVMESIPIDLNNHNGNVLREIDEDAFNVYLNIVHPYLPLLASTKVRVEAQLVQCPPRLRDAFIEALYGTMQSLVSSPGRYTNGDVSSASRLITEWESDSSPRTLIVNLVHLQTLILVAIATDNYGPSSLKGEHGGPSKASILGRAVGLAYSMRLHVSNLDSNVNVQLDHDSDDNVATRAWWTLIMLDRWNAIGTATPLFIPNDSVVILPSLNSILGENVYHLARLSNILGHFTPVSLAPPKALTPESGAVPILNSFFNLSIELFREVLPPAITPATHPIIHLVYWHCRLLAYLFQTNSKSTDILWPCKESVNLLLTNTQLLSPLNHHFFCLTALTLLELAKVDRTRDEANPLVKELLESNLAPSTWDAVIRDRIAESLRPSTAQAAASQSLQHLADLATASEAEAVKPPETNGESVTLRTSQNYGDVGFDPTGLTRRGYLNVLAEAGFMATR
ncbi:hypothetical protein F4810DRAFT_476844 [Camillea tinctor]|nr:hypothetical protein F4810DRAFT_476844 [Camillea tinctor]